MDVYKFIEEIGGEITNGRALYRRGNEYVLIGTLTEDGMIFTKDGAALKAQYVDTGSTDAPTEVGAEEPEVVVEAPVVEAVEVEEPVEEPAEEESADLESLFAELDADDESNAN